MVLSRSSECENATDSGFSIVEIVVSAAIMFIVATALFGLLATSTLLSITAKANGLAVNQANSFIEKVRDLAYADVTQARLDTLAAASSTTVDGIAVSVTATVTPQWFQGQNQSVVPPPYKHVTVRVAVTRPAGTPFVYTTGTYVSNRVSTGSSAPGVAVPIPIVTLTSNTPKGDAVRGDVPLGMSAQSGGSGVLLTRLQITAAGSLVMDKLTTLASDSISGIWNTTALLDGAYEMRARARDTKGQDGVVNWLLIIDNNPPIQTPQNLRMLLPVTGNSSVTYRWDAALESASMHVADYQVVWFEQALTTSSFSPVAGTPAVVVPLDPSSATDRAFATSSFRRYYLEVRSRGPLATGETSPRWMSDPVTSAVYVSRPSLAGSTVNVTDTGGNKKKAVLRLDLTCDAPGFGTTGTTAYRWQFRYGPTGAWTDLGATTRTHTVASWTAPTNGKFGDMGISFRCLVTVTPAGGTQLAVPSCVTPFTRTDNQAGLATAGPNDWSRWVSPPASTPAINWGMWLP